MRIFIERPVATAMVYLAVLALGVISFLNTPLELAPKEDFPQVSVNTTWRGAPPEIIHTQVTAPLEEAVTAVKGVRKVKSSSAPGLSIIDIEFDPGSNMEFVMLSLREELARARRVLPYGVRPEVQPYVPEDFRVRPFLSYTISGSYSLQRLREMVREKLEIGLGSIKGVAQVTVEGGSDPEIRLSLEEKRLKAYGIHPYQAMAALEQRLRTYPSARMKRGNREFIVKFRDNIRGIKEIEETVVAFVGRNPILMKDVAEISPTYGDISSIHRINGQPTASLTVWKEKGENTLKTARRVKQKLEAIRKELPGDLVFRAVDDESEEIHKNLNDFYRLAAIIAAVVFTLIFLILRRLKPSLLILSSVLFSVVITFNFIYIFKISMNMLTLGALALGFGMFVDNSIVVFENILRLRESGHSPVQAALQGPKEVFVAVVASTLTTVSVFFFFPYFQGRLKVYYLPLAIVISSALLASLLVSFTLIPALSTRLIERREAEKRKAGSPVFEKLLKAVLRHPLIMILLVSVVFYGSWRWFKSEVTTGEFFRWYSRESLYVYIGMPPGSDIEKTESAVRQFEQKVLETHYEKEMNCRITTESANIIIRFPPEVENSSRPYVLKEELIQLAAQFAGMDIGVYGFDPNAYHSSAGTGAFCSSRINFFGYNLKKLKEITAELEKTLEKNPRVKEIRTVSGRSWWSREGSSENILKIDQVALRKYDVDPEYLYFHLGTLVHGAFGVPLKIRSEGREIALSFKSPQTEQMDLRTLMSSLIRTKSGEFLSLGEISILEEKPLAGSIDRENQQFMQTALWEFRGPAKAEENFRKSVFQSLHLPPGFSASMEESWLMTGEEKGQIRFAIFFSLAIIFMILAALYESLLQPLFILLAVPLALIGVFIAFVIARYPFDSSAYIGIILLGGIVVNNAILLVDHINLKRRQGLLLLDAVIQGTRDRVRPIFMTTCTTVFGILPLLLIPTEGRRQIWSALALCTVGGLVSSTIFILIVIPIFYLYGNRLRLRILGRLRK